MKKIEERIENKRNRLLGIYESDYPSDKSRWKTHERRVSNAESFLDELDEVDEVTSSGVDTKLVSESRFNDLIEKSDYYEFVFEGKYVKIAMVCIFPMSSRYWIKLIDESISISNFVT